MRKMVNNLKKQEGITFVVRPSGKINVSSLETLLKEIQSNQSLKIEFLFLIQDDASLYKKIQELQKEDLCKVALFDNADLSVNDIIHKNMFSKYIVFADAIPTSKLDLIELLYKKAEATNSDILINNPKLDYSKCTNYEKIIYEILKNNLMHKSFLLYKRSFLEQCGFDFCMDNSLNFFSVFLTEKISVCNFDLCLKNNLVLYNKEKYSLWEKVLSRINKIIEQLNKKQIYKKYGKYILNYALSFFQEFMQVFFQSATQEMPEPMASFIRREIFVSFIKKYDLHFENEKFYFGNSYAFVQNIIRNLIETETQILKLKEFVQKDLSKVVVVAFFVDKNSIDYVGASINSIVNACYSTDRFYDVYVFYNQSSLTNGDILKLENLSRQNIRVFAQDISNYKFQNDTNNNADFYLKLPELLPLYPKILFLSPYTIIQEDIAKIFDEGCSSCLAAVPTTYLSKDTFTGSVASIKKGICLDVVLLNSSFFKRQQIYDKYVNLYRKKYSSIDFFKEIIGEQLFYLDKKWRISVKDFSNPTSLFCELKTAGIITYSPQDISKNALFSSYFLQTLLDSPFYETFFLKSISNHG